MTERRMSTAGRVLGVLGGLAIVLGAFLPWADPGQDVEASAGDLRLLWSFGANESRLTTRWFESLLIVVLVAAALIIVGSLAGSTGITIVGAVVATTCTVAWALREAGDRSPASFDLFNQVGNGALFAAAGCALALVGSLIRTDHA